jgi:hypothetical protein
MPITSFMHGPGLPTGQGHILRKENYVIKQTKRFNVQLVYSHA